MILTWKYIIVLDYKEKNNFQQGSKLLQTYIFKNREDRQTRIVTSHTQRTMYPGVLDRLLTI